MKQILALLAAFIPLIVSAQEAVPATRIIPSGHPMEATATANEKEAFVQLVIDSVKHNMTTIKLKSDELMTFVRAQELTPERRAVADSMANAYMKLYEQTQTYVREQINSHLESPATAQLINEFQQMIGLEFVADFMTRYPHAGQESLAEIRAMIDSEKYKLPGAELLDFEIPDEVGEKHHLNEYVGHGRYVLLDFWASWCGPCMQELPNVKAAYERFHERGFDIVGLSFDTNREAWLRAVADKGMAWTQLSDLQGWKCIAGKVYNVRAIPFTLLFGPDGKVVASNLRGEALGRKLEELLGN